LPVMTADEQTNWRIEFEKTGEAEVRQNLSNPAIYNSPAKADFARQWLREREGAREQREQQIHSYTRRTLLAAVAGVVVGLVAILIAGGSWLYPNQPAAPKPDPDFIYQSGSQIGHVLHSDVIAGDQSWRLFLKLDRTQKLNISDLLEFRGIRCVVYLLGGEKKNSNTAPWRFSYDMVQCTII
jgi:hypothetical protein